MAADEGVVPGFPVHGREHHTPDPGLGAANTPASGGADRADPDAGFDTHTDFVRDAHAGGAIEAEPAAEISSGADADAGAGFPFDAAEALKSGFSGVAEVLTGLVAGLRDVRGCDAAGLVAAAGAVERVARLVGAAQVLIAAGVQATCTTAVSGDSVAVRMGCRNEFEVLQRVTRARRSELAQRLRLAKHVAAGVGFTGALIPPSMAAVSAALVSGEVSTECASRIVDAVERGGRRVSERVRRNAEQVLVQAATGVLAPDALDGFDLATSDPADLTPDNTPNTDTGDGVGVLPLHDDEVRVFASAIRERLDTDGAEPSHRVEAARFFRIGPQRGGLHRVTGNVLPEVAALLARECDALLTPKRRPRFVPASPTDTQAGGWGVTGAGGGSDDGARDGAAAGPAGDTAPAPDAADADGVAGDASVLVGHPMVDERSADQRRHDAFASMLAFLARHDEMPALGGAPVTVLIQVKEEHLTAGTGAGWVHGVQREPVPVPISRVRHAACAGTVKRVTEDDRGRIVGIGIPSRVFNASQRQAITLRDGGCIIPGCTVPASWCEIHHVTEWQRGGPTHTDNGVLLCWHHHRTLDDSTWEIRIRDGVPQVRPPSDVDLYRRWYRTGSLLRRAEHALTA